MNDSSLPEGETGQALAAAAPGDTPAEAPALDAHGRNPADYDWVPVLRKPRADGWTPSRQRRFIQALADTGSVRSAAQKVGMSETSCYALRRAPGAGGFAAAWAAAIEEASRRLVDEAFERALVGSDEPVFNRDGDRVGRRFRQSDKMLMFLLRAYMPDRFRYASREQRAADEPAPPAIEAVASALALLEPARPADPAALLDPDELECRLQVADMLPGALPRWHRDPDQQPPPSPMPLGEKFEREMEDAKRGAARQPALTDAEWAEHRAMLIG